jgi:hypothetical protein
MSEQMRNGTVNSEMLDTSMSSTFDDRRQLVAESSAHAVMQKYPALGLVSEVTIYMHCILRLA